MGLEEQQEEREVLESIFPEEITDTGDHSYRVSITLDLPTDASPEEKEEEEEEPCIILLNVSYPEAYPDVAPNLDITAPPNSAKHPFLDVAADKAQLLNSLTTTVEDSMGMAMVFTLVATLKDSAEALIADRQRQQEEIREVAVRKAEEEENRKFHGEKVTRERFLEWRERFRREMDQKDRLKREEDEAELKTKKGVKNEEKKLTGRQLWERGLVGKVDDDIDADGILDGTDKLKLDG